jgi:guanylate kinase
MHQSVNPEILEKLLQEAQKETNYPSTSISVQSSPKSPQTPITNITYQSDYDLQTSFNHIDLILNDCCSKSAYVSNINNKNSSNKLSIQNSLLQQQQEQQQHQQQEDNEIINIKKDTDWIWYWSSRPQMQPPK